MKLKIKPNTSNIFLTIYILIIIFNLIIFFYFFYFIKNNVTKAIYVDHNYLLSQNQNSTSDINMDKFNIIIKNIENKINKKAP